MVRLTPNSFAYTLPPYSLSLTKYYYSINVISISLSLPFRYLHPSSFNGNMNEECGRLAGDCTAVCCCCQCLLFEFTLFILLHLPVRLVKRMMRAWRLDRNRIKGSKRTEFGDDKSVANVCAGHVGFCYEEERIVWEELMGKGLFWFGSFWDGDSDWDGNPKCSNANANLGT